MKLFLCRMRVNSDVARSVSVSTRYRKEKQGLPFMSSTTRPLAVSRTEAVSSKWARRRDIPIAILAWTALVCIVLWGIGHIVRTLLLLTIAALLAYALAPGVKVLQRFMPRFLAILMMYLLVLGAISFLLFLIITTAIEQVGSLASNVQKWLTPRSAGHLSPLEPTLRTLGISSEQITSVRTQ